MDRPARPRASTRSCAGGASCSASIPAARMREARRVLGPGGRIALAVWDGHADNPWATIPTAALDRGRATWRRRTATRPGCSLSPTPGRLQEMLEEAGLRRRGGRVRGRARVVYDTFEEFVGRVARSLERCLGAALERAVRGAARRGHGAGAEALAAPFTRRRRGDSASRAARSWRPPAPERPAAQTAGGHNKARSK